MVIDSFYEKTNLSKQDKMIVYSCKKLNKAVKKF